MNGKMETPSQVSLWAVVKRFLTIFLPLSALLGGIVMVLYYADAKTERVIFGTHEINNVNYQMETIADDFRSIVSDLMVLSAHHELQVVFESGEARHRKDLAEEFLVFCDKKRLYDQIRFLDETGMEVVRVNFNDGKPYIVPEEGLQSKADRYYFRDTFGLGRGEVYVSPFDLNIEHGKIEQPLKPIIRFGTPVFDSLGRKRGIVILNYLGAKLIHDLERVSANLPGQIMLLNSDGFWLKGPRPEDEWGFMYEDGGDRTFGKALPDVWGRISGAESGQFRGADGMFTFATVYPLLECWKSSTGSEVAFEPSAARLEAKEYYWKVVSHVSPDVLNATPRKLLGRFLLLYAVLVVPLAIGSWFVSRASIRRKRAEEALRESEERLRNLFETMAEGVVLIAPDGQIVQANTAAERIAGLKRSEIEGHSYDSPEWNLLRPDGTRMPPEEMPGPRTMKEKRPVKDAVVGVKRPDGSISWINVNTTPFINKTGEIDGIVLTFADITERKQAEETLRESEEKLRLIFENAFDGISIYEEFSESGTRRLLDCNERYAQMSGRSKKELLEIKNTLSVQSPIEPVTGNEALKTLQERTPYKGLFSWMRPDGVENIIEYNAVPVKAGERTLTIGLDRDITERMRAEEAILRAKEEWERTFDAVPDLITIIDTQHRIMRANRAMADKLGVTPQEAVGLTCYRCVHGTEEPPPFCPHAQLMADGQEHTAEIREERLGGDYFISVSPFYDAEGGLIGCVHVARDITDRKRVEEQIKASLKEKEVLLKEIHHRVKNNMQVVISMLKLQSGHIKDKQALEIFKDSQNRVRSMALVHEKLYRSGDLAKIDLGEYIRSLTNSLFHSYRTSSAAIKLKINIEDVLLDIDGAIPCGLIINELLSNSLKYAFPAGVEGEIYIDLSADNNKVTLLVGDNGVGFPEDLDFRDTQSLGLQLVNTLTDQLDGTIELDRNGGTEFKITFSQ